MTMPGRRGRRFGWRAAGPAPMLGFRGRRLVELQQRRVQFRLDRLAQQQARLTRLMEVLQERSAPEPPGDRSRATRGGDRESPFSGRTPPHGGSGGEGAGGRRGSEGATSTESEEAPEESEEADPSRGGGAARAEESGEEADQDDVLRTALFQVFDELVDRDDPALPRAAQINAALKERGLDPIRHSDARAVYEEWLAGHG